MFIARRAVCFVRKWWKLESPTVCCYKLEKYNPYYDSGKICAILKNFRLKYFVEFHHELDANNIRLFSTIIYNMFHKEHK